MKIFLALLIWSIHQAHAMPMIYTGPVAPVDLQHDVLQLDLLTRDFEENIKNLIELQGAPIVISTSGSGALRSPAFHSLCRRMPGNHLADIELLERAYQELKANVANVEKVSELVREIKEISSRIRFLANPEWNSETIPVEIYWKIPNSLFFDDSAYLDLRQTVRQKDFAPRLDPDSFNKFWKGIFKQPSIDEVKLISSEYINTSNTEIGSYLHLDMPLGTTQPENDSGFQIGLVKIVTPLEACQFLNTVLFEVKISYKTHLQIIDKFYKQEKTIFLIYRNEEASAK